MDKVFISYSSKDKYFAELLEIKLKEKGIEVWRDTTALKAGEEWRTSIDSGIRECFAIVLALSPASCVSHYVTYEWARGIGESKTIIPVLLEDCDRHPKIEPIQYLDFRSHSESDWDRLTNRIKEANTDGEQIEPIINLVKTDEKKPIKISPKQRKAKNEIKAYLNERGFRMMSFERVQSKLSKDYDNDFLKDLISKVRSFAPATLKGKKDGLKLI